MNVVNIGKVIVTLLSDVEVTKVTPLIAPNGTLFPNIVYTRTSTQSAQSKDLPQGCNGVQTATFDVDIWHNDYDSSLRITQDVINALDHKRGIINELNVVEVIVDNAVEQYVDGAYLQTLKITIKYN